MTDLPIKVDINEEGPREGFQIEKGDIPPSPVAALDLILHLHDTRGMGIASASAGLKMVCRASTRRLPGWAAVRSPGTRARRVTPAPKTWSLWAMRWA